MSAKEFYHKLIPPNLPYLPPELWQTILREATFVLSIFDPELMQSSELSTNSRDCFKAYKHSLKTRNNLVRVCKAWYTLGLPYLYEYVLLGRARCLIPLLCALRQSDSSGEIRAAGWWVRRLDVNLRDESGESLDAFDTVADILLFLPNLEILTFYITGHAFESLRDKHWGGVLDASRTCAKSLKFLHWYNHNQCLPREAELTRFIQAHPALESLSAPVYTKRDANMSLNAVKNLYVYPYEPHSSASLGLCELDLQSVRHATYRCFDRDPQPFRRVNKLFFQKIGPQLTSLRLIWSADYNFATQGTTLAQCLRDTRDEILHHCNSLERFDLHTHQYHIKQLHFLAFPSTVKVFGIRLDPVQTSKQKFHLLVDKIRALLEEYRHVKVLQFLDRGNVRCLRQNPTVLADCVRAMKDLGVQVQDDEGQSLQ
ncbi:unnamed protein product [Cyclocybe aegerita]|uniref:F-box domain-containing protein n=1 Tax=Cyclocybe aegerita TaxID=1973307 RepID=A0A8S0X8C8_CYCAE|nr:unnamed protein product [Cyclocybe aegerita]